MISTSHRILVLAILLALAASSVAYGAEVPLSFIGTYQGLSRACMTSIIVLRRENITWDECESKNVPYTVVEADEQHVLLEVLSSDCPLPFIRLGGAKLDDANSVQGGLRVSGYRSRSEALAGNFGLDCSYHRVDPAFAEDQTASFLNSKSATEREKALDIINQQIHSERDKYNEIGLRDPSPAVRAKAASFLRGAPDRFVPLLIKTMAHDPDPKVRARAGGSLSSFYRDIDYGGDSDSDGDNDSATDLHITPLEENLDDLLIGLKRAATVRSVVGILGGDDYYGGSAVCHMSAKNQEKTLHALKHQLETIQLVDEVFRALHPSEPPSRWSGAGQDIPRAIEKISKCHLIAQSTRPPDSASAPDDLKEEQQRPLPADHRKRTCEFAGLALPESYAIFAAGGYSGRKIDFQIDQSGHQATQMDVTVNYSSKPVVLMLGAYEPTIWNIKWTATTRIVAVLVSGYHRQAIAGLDASVPMLNSSYDNRGPCGYFYVSERENPEKLNKTSRSLFGRPVDLVYRSKNGDILIGDPVPAGEKLITSESNSPESFHDRTTPIAGPAGLEDAVRKGLLRKATAEDFDAWVDTVIANIPKPDLPSIAGRGRPKPPRPVNLDAYVVLRQFTYPAGLGGGNAATFFIPEGVQRPKGTPGHSDVYDFNTFKIEPAPTGTMDLQQRPVPQARDENQITNGEVKPSIPEDAFYVRSKKARGSGKYYFEVTVNHGNIKQNLEADLEIGVKGGGKLIATDYRIGPQDLVIHTGGGGSVTIVGGNRGTDIRLTKVVIGVAVDLDSRRFYCRRDGNWMGKPPGHESGTALPSGDEFYAEIASSVSMPELLASNIVSLNFGELPFAYPPPIGYTAFDADSPSGGKPSTDAAAFPAFSLVDPGTPIEGLSLSVWIQRYWQWMKSFPPGESPSDDATGARCNAGQAGEVFFLAGSNQEAGEITRTCLVPKGKFVFIPLMNALVEKVSPQGTATCDSLVRQARSITEAVADLSVTINGQNITSLSSFKGESGCFEILDASIPSTCPAAAAGYWLALNPLTAGNHEIQFSGTFKGTRFVKRMKYNLRVE